VCVLVYLALRYVARTPFGIALQGIRDDPVRMSALGYNVRLHRTLGFALAAPVAGLAGVISAWSYTRMSADSVSLSVSIFVLAAAVIGGLFRLEGAWVGAFVYTVLSTYLSSWTDRYATWIGVIFLVIVLVSPGGLVGAASAVGARLRRRPRRPAGPEPPVPVKTPTGGVA
jgi:branched-chain amino acid transport system permease protein